MNQGILLNGLYQVAIVVLLLLPIANPFSTSALFMGITSNLSKKERQQQAFLAAIYMFIILAVFLIFGVLIMKFFGISIPGVRIAGGLIVAYIGFRMLFPSYEEISTEETKTAQANKDVALFPIAMPSLAGPGTIAAVLSISSETGTWLGYGLVLIGIFITAVISWLTLRASASLAQRLGPNGISILARIMGFLLVCIAVQFIAGGIHSFIEKPEININLVPDPVKKENT